jgi:hypothetical protein
LALVAALLAMSLASPMEGRAAEKEKAGIEAARCGSTPLASCTQSRVAALRSLATRLRALAARRYDDRPSTEEAGRRVRYDQWLLTTADRAEALAQSGSTANLMSATQQMQEQQMSFNLQYLQLQENMQNESRAFTTVSNIMKTKQDTANALIGNLK